MANIKDFAVGLVVTAPSPATSGTTLTLRTGEGATMPATPFFATASPPGQLTTIGTSEKISVTGVSGDTLTFVRAQGSTTAQSIAAGWVIANSIYAADVAAVGNNTITTKEVPTGSINGSNATFTCSQSYVGSSLQAYVNGIAQSGFITETTPASGIFTLDVAPSTGDTVVVSYQHVASVTGNSDTVDGFHASSTPTANTLVPLGGATTFPGAVIDNVTVARQDNTTNSLLTSARIETGWGVIGNNTGSAAQNESITYRTAFTVPPIVIAVCGGDHGSSTTYGSGGNTVEGRIALKATNVSTTGFQVWVHQEGGTNFAAGNTFYQWIAIGV